MEHNFVAAEGSLTPWRRNPESIRTGLIAWCAEKLKGATLVALDIPQGGMANETALFSLDRGQGAERFVARMAPLPASPYQTFPVYDLELQRRCIDLLSRETDAPVPRVLQVEQDPAWVGSPFMVMSFIEGRAPLDNPPYIFTGWLLEASAAERRHLQERSVEMLARIHRITADRHDLGFFNQERWGASPLEQAFAYQRWLYDWAREGGRYPLVERMLDALARTLPENRDAVLTWGDARIGNILYRGFDPVAILDWEMAGVGPAEVDVGWMVFFHRMFQDMAERFGYPGLPDFMRPEDVVRVYEQTSGRTLQDLGWYQLFAAARFSILSIRTGLRSIAYGEAQRPDDPDDLLISRSLFERMLADHERQGCGQA
ncbi:hypothetical protein B9N43_05865 [Denitratisoma sp. DHT3]|uniref:phosphotransferase family protein n=1 Tax=Denitratisoma sp. DHT3 TaxID=1981880 RepID=UPI00119850B5|nr:phosphotransferase family protein [Denitratisoma sp. DHT3]QDX80810.1 hypothetical protein B9N43_05865 [Denitratisoma sp. DHT3]